ncbi:hypothetical protein G9X64_16690 [Rhizobium sophorae]|uniref:Uncharacterized protein n=1 Tax=Rhizobium sophorae TaxID=1535242 RepID=A0A7Y3S6N4_9HYPH|nr:hypothetical protein [Rhizobium sophorae]MBX4863387.1 hypothetical protein [Rhizobium bangladeshense]NNU38093.1 hypothetical protein [Rhizobium sophorae]
MGWGAAEWGAIASAAAAIATAAAGYMALVAANRTIKATREAASENAALLRDQIEVQRRELAEVKSAAIEADRRQKLLAAYSIFRLTGEVHAVVSFATNNHQGENPIIPHFSDNLIRRVEAAYPLQSYLNRENHIGFQLLDAVVHGETLNNKEQALYIINRLNALRQALTPAIVGLPKGDGSRIYGSDGITPLVATPDADI